MNKKLLISLLLFSFISVQSAAEQDVPCMAPPRCFTPPPHSMELDSPLRKVTKSDVIVLKELQTYYGSEAWGDDWNDATGFISQVYQGAREEKRKTLNDLWDKIWSELTGIGKILMHKKEQNLKELNALNFVINNALTHLNTPILRQHFMYYGVANVVDMDRFIRSFRRMEDEIRQRKQEIIDRDNALVTVIYPCTRCGAEKHFDVLYKNKESVIKFVCHGCKAIELDKIADQMGASLGEYQREGLFGHE